MSHYKKTIILLNLLLLVILLLWSLAGKEQTLRSGQLVLLELAPVDPRSLMQGDYMQLDYAMSGGPSSDRMSKTGYFIIKADEHHVAHKLRVQNTKQPLRPGELAIRYSMGEFGSINIGAGSYFFEEGKGEKFSQAKYGGLKVDQNGNCILVGLFDEQGRQIKP